MAGIFKNDKFVLLLLCLVYIGISYNVESPTIDTLALMGWLGISQLVFSLIAWMKRGNQFLSPYILFLLTLYMFSYGQSFLWAFGLESERTLIGFYGITIPEIFKAQIWTIVMLAFFQIGASYYVDNYVHNYNVDNVAADTTNKLKRIGWILFVVSVIPYTSETIQDLIISMTKGYGAIYGAGKVGFDNIAGFIADYFMPSVICLFIVYRNNRVMRNFLLSIIGLNIIAILLTGGRSNAVILMSLVLIMYNYLVRRFTRKWIIVGVVGGFFLLQILAVVANVRTDAGRSASVSEVKLENNGAVDAVAEMGSTMFCLIKSQDIVPSKEDYRYGKSYLYSFTTIIPNLGFWAIHPATKESNLGDWLTAELGLGYGTGFSMCAEAYVNFGYLCFLAFFFWGIFLAKVFGRIEISVKTTDYALLAFLLILFWFFLKLPRNNFINLVRPIFFVAGPIYLYCKKITTRK